MKRAVLTVKGRVQRIGYRDADWRSELLAPAPSQKLPVVSCRVELIARLWLEWWLRGGYAPPHRTGREVFPHLALRECIQDSRFGLTTMSVLPSANQTASAAETLRISGSIPSRALQPSIPSHGFTNSLLPARVQGSVLRWRLAVPQVGLSPNWIAWSFSAHPQYLHLPRL